MVFPESWKRSCSNFNALDCKYVGKLFEPILFVKVLRIIESIIQRQMCDLVCKYKSHHKCYLESIEYWDIVFYIIDAWKLAFIGLVLTQIDIDILMKFPLFISLFYFLDNNTNKSNCRCQNLNYYFDFAVCASFRLRLCLRPSVRKNFPTVPHIKRCF